MHRLVYLDIRRIATKTDTTRSGGFFIARRNVMSRATWIALQIQKLESLYIKLKRAWRAFKLDA